MTNVTLYYAEVASSNPSRKAFSACVEYPPPVGRCWTVCTDIVDAPGSMLETLTRELIVGGYTPKVVAYGASSPNRITRKAHSLCKILLKQTRALHLK